MAASQPMIEIPLGAAGISTVERSIRWTPDSGHSKLAWAAPGHGSPPGAVATRSPPADQRFELLQRLVASGLIHRSPSCFQLPWRSGRARRKRLCTLPGLASMRLRSPARSEPRSDPRSAGRASRVGAPDEAALYVARADDQIAASNDMRVVIERLIARLAEDDRAQALGAGSKLGVCDWPADRLDRNGWRRAHLKGRSYASLLFHRRAAGTCHRRALREVRPCRRPRAFSARPRSSRGSPAG